MDKGKRYWSLLLTRLHHNHMNVKFGLSSWFAQYSRFDMSSYHPVELSFVMYWWVDSSIKGSFTYYVIKEGEGGFQMITFDYEGGGGFWPMITSSKIFVFFTNFY